MDGFYIEAAPLRKLLGAGSGDSALLYLYIKSGGRAEDAGKALNMPDTRLGCAMATLRQLGLVEDARPAMVIPGERPNYSEKDVLDAANSDTDFCRIYSEVQRLLGHPLNTEELKIVLGFVRYLGLPGEVVSVLVCYCKERARRQGNLRHPSLRTIEKEAYTWAEQGIQTLEDAAAYVQQQNERFSRLGQLKTLLQIQGRNLTASEEKYADAWLKMGFDQQALSIAYDRTCVNTGRLNWKYMDTILNRWHQAGLHTGEQVRQGDRKPATGKPSGELGQEELDAIRRMMHKQEG